MKNACLKNLATHKVLLGATKKIHLKQVFVGKICVKKLKMNYMKHSPKCQGQRKVLDPLGITWTVGNLWSSSKNLLHNVLVWSRTGTRTSAVGVILCCLVCSQQVFQLRVEHFGGCRNSLQKFTHKF